jgi:hypothetical protein
MGLLHVDLPALASQKNMDAPVAIADGATVMIGGPIEFQHGARPPDRDAPIVTNRRRQLALASRPYSFRRITS